MEPYLWLLMDHHHHHHMELTFHVDEITIYDKAKTLLTDHLHPSKEWSHMILFQEALSAY